MSLTPWWTHCLGAGGTEAQACVYRGTESEFIPLLVGVPGKEVNTKIGRKVVMS